jgi:putative DNA primase/helicase
MVDTTTQAELSELALQYLAGGLSLVPCSAKTKQPDNDLLPCDENGKPGWKRYQSEPARAATVKGWFRRGCRSVAVVGGKVSGGLCVLDFDEPRFYPAWLELVGTLADGLPTQQTGGGGYQVMFRCPEPGRNDKLAWIADDAEEKTGRRIAIETRGEGGYAVMPGSLHPSGNTYRAIAGDFGNIPTVPQAVADALLAACHKLDEAPLTRKQMEAEEKAAATSTKYRNQSNGQGSVIDAYNGRATIVEALEQYGYTRDGDRYVRPGGESGSVAVVDGRSFHHSSNDTLNDGYWHRPFDLFCEYDHGGDCKEAVRAAAEMLGMNGTAAALDGDTGESKANGQDKIDYHLRSCADLVTAQFDIRFLVDGIMAAGHCRASRPEAVGLVGL